MSELCFGVFKHHKSVFNMIFHHRIHPHGVRGSLNFESGEGTGMEFPTKNDEK